MARFCGNCGSSLEESQPFCGNCGAAAGAPGGAQPAAAPPPAAPPSPAYAAPAPAAPAPSKGTSPVVKVILILVAIFAFVTVAGIGACVFIGYRAKQRLNETIKVDEGGKGITLKTPKGDIRLGESAGGATTGSETNASGAVPDYPGATLVNKGNRMTGGGQNVSIGQQSSTSDSVEDVVNFYKEQLGPEITVMEHNGTFTLTRMDKGGNGITTIHVRRDEETGETIIVTSHMGG